MSIFVEAAEGKAGVRAARGRPRDASKNSAIIDAASRIFLEKGFDGTSMDHVAKRAGVSKQTVYSHFSSKEALFGEAIHVAIAKYYPETAIEKVKEHSLEADLRAVCENYARLLMGEDAMAMYRVLVAAAPKGPALAEIFYDAGPREMKEKLCEFLQGWVDQGELVINDLGKAANRLITLVKGHSHFIQSIGLIDKISEEQLQQDVDEALEAFLRLYKKQ
jgi:TetR/AcrR family transcriptional repressor of mexJK operon